MIINPIIPIWLMSIICVILIIIILYNKQLKGKISNFGKEKTSRQKQLLKQYVISSAIKILIVVLMFIINLRFMIPNGESSAISLDLSVLFVIDTSVSMRALDYEGNKERIEGVKNDCCYIVDELAGSKFSIITFGDKAQRVIPFTEDSDMVQAEIQSIQLENDFYAKGSSMNIVKGLLKKTLEDEFKRKNGKANFALFFITDGEITKADEKLDKFSDIKQYVSNGAVLGYGTQEGGMMVNSLYKDSPSSDSYYIYYYDSNYNKMKAISKIDEANLKQMSLDLGIDYVKMNKKDNINYKIKEIKEKVSNSETQTEKKKTYQDIYYIFSIPLILLLIINFIIQKKRLE